MLNLRLLIILSLFSVNFSFGQQKKVVNSSESEKTRSYQTESNKQITELKAEIKLLESNIKTLTIEHEKLRNSNIEDKSKKSLEIEEKISIQLNEHKEKTILIKILKEKNKLE